MEALKWGLCLVLALLNVWFVLHSLWLWILMISVFKLEVRIFGFLFEILEQSYGMNK